MKTMELARNVWNYATKLSGTKESDPHYTSAPMHHYPGILSMFAGAQAAAAAKDAKWTKEVNDYLSKYPHRFHEPDVFFRGSFDNYRIGGLGKGWSVMKGYFKEDKELIREYADLTIAAPRSYDGIICHPKMHNKVWIDVVFAITPFMLYAGLILEEPSYIDYAVEQCFKMYDVFMDPSNGLLHQTRGFLPDDVNACSKDHWSRGNGWGIMGLTELVRYLPKDSKYYPEAVERFRNHCAALIKYQNYRGLWRQEIPEKFAWEEASGTGIFLYAFGVGIRTGILDKDAYFPALKKGVEALYRYCINPDYSIDKGCCGCCCPGEGEKKGTVEAYLTIPMPRRNDSHVFGPVIMALTEAYRNGILEIIE